jgi:hypothetical protein
MGIKPEVEKSTRDLLGHTIRGEWDDLVNVIGTIGEERYAQCLSLCLQVSGYITIDVVGHEWPASSKLREIAHLIAEMEDMEYDLVESDVYDLLARCALGFEPVSEVFTDKGKVGHVTISTAASLLVAYRPDGIHWWEYLDLIEQALETAAPLDEALVPALLLLTRRQRALKARETQPRLRSRRGQHRSERKGSRGWQLRPSTSRSS